uniref:Uncharacterized protein n=1 Tax=Magallana gigas TaxID=29159 RepID=A0A8W8I3L5_MAGGI
MIFKLCFVLCFIALKDVACAWCPSVTEAMAKTCISEDPRCSPVPVVINNGTCFRRCNYVCSNIVDGTRCANPTQSEVESCNDFGDEL